MLRVGDEGLVQVSRVGKDQTGFLVTWGLTKDRQQKAEVEAWLRKFRSLTKIWSRRESLSLIFSYVVTE